MHTVYDLKAKLSTVGEELAAVDADLIAKLANPAVAIEEINKIEGKKADLQKRFDLLKAAHDKAEADQKAKFQMKNPVNPVVGASTDKERLVAAKAEFIRAAVQGRPVSEEARNVLRGSGATNDTGGEKLLPTTLTTELLHEPFVTNPLRGHIRVSNIKGLEVPKISYTLDDDGYVTDEETAKEIELDGDKVSFGRNKFKVKVRVSDTVLHGSDADLVAYVENALRSGLAAKEKKISFDAAAATAYQHMSFYGVGIAQVNGASKLAAIKAAIAALHEDYRENAKVAMRFSDFIEIVEGLANGNAALFDAPPERIIGKPVIFSDSAVDPIVGDFGYCRLNYDGELIYDSDKDVESGEYIWVLTGWHDQQIMLKSAFRIAKYVPAP